MCIVRSETIRSKYNNACCVDELSYLLCIGFSKVVDAADESGGESPMLMLRLLKVLLIFSS